jgi:hypothetical protein
MKEASKPNGCIQKLDYRDKKKILEEVANKSPLLMLKVLNSSFGLGKGTQIRINCLGLLGNDNIVISERRDGIVYFGHVLEDEIANTSIDYSIPVAKTSVERSDQANMYIHIYIVVSIFLLSLKSINWISLLRILE